MIVPVIVSKLAGGGAAVLSAVLVIKRKRL